MCNESVASAGYVPECRGCVHFFLGCLNGRKKWTDKASTPNFRYAGQSGREYIDPPSVESEFPLRCFCDAFEADPDPSRRGRVV